MALTSAYVGPSGATIAVVGASNISAISLGQIYAATVTGASGSSSWVLPGGSATVPIGSTPAAVQTLLEGVVGSGNVVVAGYEPYRVTFATSQASFSVNTSGLSSTRSTDPTTAGSTAYGEGSFVQLVGTWSQTYGNSIGGLWLTNNGNGDSGSYVIYQKTGLATGTYAAYATYVGGAGYGTNVRYRIYDGSTLVRVVTVDQTSPCPYDYQTTANANGYNFVPSKLLGNIYISSGTLKIVVCNECNGKVDVSPFAFNPVSPVTADAAFTRSVSQTVTLVGSPSYTVNGGASTPFTGPPLWSLAGDQNYATFLLGSTLSSSDTVSVFMPSGSVTLADGPIADTTLTATNRTGGKILDAFDPTSTRTFKLGYNIGNPSYADVHQTFANLMRACPQLGAVSGLTAPTFDSDGNVVSGSGGTILRTGQSNVLDANGYRNCPQGTYTIKYTGAGDVYLADNASNRTDLGTVGGFRTITYTVPGTVSAPEQVDLHIRIDGPAYNVAVYPPGADTSDPSAFWPAYLTQLQGSYVLRTMTWFGAIYNSILDATDFTPTTQVSWADGDTYKTTYTISSIAAYDNSDSFFPSGYAPALLTFSAPHDLAEMASIQLLSSGGVGGTIAVPVSGGGTVDINNYTYQVHYNAATMTTSQVAVGIQYTGTVSGTLSTPGVATRARRYCPPLAKVIELANTVGAHLWVNVPPADATTRAAEAWTAAFRQIARDLSPSLKCYVEFANEPWNFAFPPYHYFRWKANKIGSTLMGAYALMAGQWHTVARNAFAAEGRSTSDVQRVFGTFTGTPSFTQDLCVYAAANGIPIDYLALAPYIYFQPDLQSGLDAAYNALTDAQVADLAEYWIKWGQDVVRQNVSAHRAYLDASGFTSAKICNYEQATAYGRFGGTSTNQAKHSQGLHKNPRLKNMLLAEFKALQDQGTEFGCWYTLAGGYAAEGGAAGTSMYASYMGCDMTAGNGDGSDGKNDNRVAPYTVAGSVSVAGQAVIDWNAAVTVVRRWFGISPQWRWFRRGRR